MNNNKTVQHSLGRAFAVNLMQNLVVPSFVLDPECRVLIWNCACERLTGFSAAEVIGTRDHWMAFYAKQRMTLADLIVTGRLEELSTLYPYYAEQAEYGSGIKAENWCVMPRKGTRLYLAIDAGPIFAEDGTLIAVVETLRDMTTHKLAEQGMLDAMAAAEKALQKLDESTQSLRVLSRAIEQSPVMNVITDVRGVIQYVNPKFQEITGYSTEEAIGKNISMLKADVHPKEFFSDLWATISAGREWRGEMCNKKKNGEIYWEYVSISPVRNDKGEIAQFIASKEDITERKRADEALRINASVFDNTREAIVITDADNVILDVNPAFTRITGYSRLEALGNNPRMLCSGRQDKDFYNGMWQSLLRAGEWRGEIWNRRKCGQIYAEMLSISAICDDRGQVIRHVAVFSDISHIKEHEAELRRVAHFDALTGIPNRVLLADRMKQAIARTAREKIKMAVCYLDLDGFKGVNDSMGHEAGDQVLIEVACRIGKSIRCEDTVARLGGDEFVILLVGLEKGAECVVTLNRLLATIGRPIAVEGREISLGASIGVSIYPLDDADPDTLLRHADQAMYVSKQTGKNCFHIYEPATGSPIRGERSHG